MSKATWTYLGVAAILHATRSPTTLTWAMVSTFTRHQRFRGRTTLLKGQYRWSSLFGTSFTSFNAECCQLYLFCRHLFYPHSYNNFLRTGKFYIYTVEYNYCTSSPACRLACSIVSFFRTPWTWVSLQHLAEGFIAIGWMAWKQ